MTQFETAVQWEMTAMIVEGKMVAIETTSSYCPTLYIIGMEDENGNYPYVTYSYDDGRYYSMGMATPEEYEDHYNEAIVQGVKIWEREDNDE